RPCRRPLPEIHGDTGNRTLHSRRAGDEPSRRDPARSFRGLRSGGVAMKRPAGRGITHERGAAGFDTAVLGTSFSGRDPGVRPQVLVQANDVFDVIAAVKRARRENLKIGVCSGGHSWMQNHLRDGGMLIDMARVNKVEVDAARGIAYAGPGCWSVDLDTALKKHDLFFPIAHAVDVCLG